MTAGNAPGMNDGASALVVTSAARARQLGAPSFATPTRDVAVAYLALGTGLAVEGLIDPEILSENLLGEIVALVYQGLVARAERGR